MILTGCQTRCTLRSLGGLASPVVGIDRAGWARALAIHQRPSIAADLLTDSAIEGLSSRAALVSSPARASHLVAFGAAVELGVRTATQLVPIVAAGKVTLVRRQGRALGVVATTSDLITRVSLRPVATRLGPVNLVVVDSGTGRDVPCRHLDTLSQGSVKEEDRGQLKSLHCDCDVYLGEEGKFEELRLGWVWLEKYTMQLI